MVDPVRRAPGNFPEQLSNDTRRTVAANVTQPIWVKFRIPTNAGVGTYSGTVTVNTSLGQVQVPVTIETTLVILSCGRMTGASSREIRGTSGDELHHRELPTFAMAAPGALALRSAMIAADCQHDGLRPALRRYG